MLNSIKKLLPTKEDSEKLRFEFWKVFIFAGTPVILAILGVSIPVIRKWIIEIALAAWNCLGENHVVNGWLVLAGVLGIAFSVGVISRFFWRFRLPSFTRNFREGVYDGIRWEWSWDLQSVRRASLTPFCVDCGTELMIKNHRDQYDATHTSIFCTGCNKPWGFSHVSDLRDHIRRKIERDARRGTRPEGLDAI